METVLLGRHPHIARWQWESARDLAIASDALVAVGLAGYEERDVLTLSGGERRRASLAAVLAQTPRLFLLDEPTNQLDPNHQLEALQLLRVLADAGAAVIVTLHDPNLAERFADSVLLIGKDGDWRARRISDILSRIFRLVTPASRRPDERVFRRVNTSLVAPASSSAANTRACNRPLVASTQGRLQRDRSPAAKSVNRPPASVTIAAAAISRMLRRIHHGVDLRPPAGNAKVPVAIRGLQLTGATSAPYRVHWLRCQGLILPDDSAAASRGSNFTHGRALPFKYAPQPRSA
jgi:energy-coupling factor transporter ATP-binding protein EcfA2